MNIETINCSKSNYGSVRSTSCIEWIVIHYTGNDGDTAHNNGRYFANNSVSASAHDFIDSTTLVHSVPYDRVAWSVGGNKYPNTNGGKYHGICTNTNSISIELCDDNRDGNIYPSQATIENALAHVKHLMSMFNVDQSHVIRHFDVTGKLCPAYWVDDNKWRNEFWNHLATNNTPVPTPQPVKINMQYQVFAKGKGWLPEVINYNDVDGNGYAGISGLSMLGFRARSLGDASIAGYLEYQVHIKGGHWCDWRRDYDTDSSGDTFAGTCKNEIDAIRFRIMNVAPGHHVRYHVHTVDGVWYDWILDYNEVNGNGYAGCFGHAIDVIQAEII